MVSSHTLSRTSHCHDIVLSYYFYKWSNANFNSLLFLFNCLWTFKSINRFTIFIWGGGAMICAHAHHERETYGQGPGPLLKEPWKQFVSLDLILIFKHQLIKIGENPTVDQILGGVPVGKNPPLIIQSMDGQLILFLMFILWFNLFSFPNHDRKQRSS